MTLHFLCRPKITKKDNRKNQPNNNKSDIKEKIRQIKLRKLKRQRLKAKIISKLNSINRQDQGSTSLTASNDNSNRRIFNAIMGDLSLSRKDFLSLLITWFRRSIWFLAFAGAYTTSPPLLFVAVSMKVQSEYSE